MDANSNKFISCKAYTDKLSILKKTRKLLTIACLSVFFIHTISAQEVKKKSTIYFLADTVDIPKNSRVLEIGILEGVITYYAFFCPCKSIYNFYPMFTVAKERIKLEKSATLPIGNYISWEKLVGLFSKYGNDFPNNYELIIVEKQPNRTYQTVDRLNWSRRRPPE
ncbi:hypothetical protein [Pedobacter sp. GR22-6]|uniref:hypothetical protein n=1 Tax=Pedobacter sp. GR22-6 TaxID=3127957 RepID=UPI00307DCCC9